MELYTLSPRKTRHADHSPAASLTSMAFLSPITFGTSFLQPRQRNGSPATTWTPRGPVAPVTPQSASTVHACASHPSQDPLPQSDGAGKRAELERLFKMDLSESSKGKCDCVWCSGSGRRPCAWCDGNGQRDEFLMQTWESLGRDIDARMDGSTDRIELPERVPTVCSACEGSKMLRCAYCKGSGIGSYGHAY
jgi:hypothetical protein